MAHTRWNLFNGELLIKPQNQDCSNDKKGTKQKQLSCYFTDKMC